MAAARASADFEFMTTTSILPAAAQLLAWMLPGLAAQAADPVVPARTRVLVVSGGHGFERESFLQRFKDKPGITFTAVEHPLLR